MRYAPAPTAPQLSALAGELGFGVGFERRIVGGLGCTTDVLSGEGRQWVLRRHGPWWSERNPSVALKEQAVHALVGERGVPVPEVVWASEPGIFEVPAIVMEYVDGEDLLIPDDPIDAAAQLARTLAAIHTTVAGQAARLLLDTLTSPDGDRPQAFWQHTLAQRVVNRLGELRPQPGTMTLIHGDYWPGNTLWRNGRLVGVIDWEEACLGDPMNDVAYCTLDLRYLSLDEAANHFVATYREVTGHDLETLGYWTLFALSRPMPDIAQWLPAWQAKGITDISADRLRARHRELLEEALA